MRKSRGISKLEWIGAAVALMSVAMLVGSIVYQLNIPKYEKELREARRLRDDDREPEKAGSLFKSALADAETAGLKGEPILVRIRDYGDFLADYRFSYDEALPLFNRGIELARSVKDPHWEAEFYKRIAGMQYWAIKAGSQSEPDPSPALKAIELYPENFKQPTKFAADVYWALAQTYIGAHDYRKGDEYREKAKAIYTKLEKPLPEGFYRSCIDSLVGQKKYSEANELFVEQMTEEYSDNEYSANRLRSDFYTAVKDSMPQVEDLRRKAARMLDARDYDGLEKLADEMNHDSEPLSHGTWRIAYLVGGIDDTEDYSSEKRWKWRIGQIEDWMKARPSSDISKIVYAEVMTSYAWKLKKRKNSSSDNDSDDDKEEESEATKKLFNQRLEKAWAKLQRVDHKTMAWYDAALDVGWWPKWKQTDYDKIYEECRDKYPQYTQAVVNKAAYLKSCHDGDDEDSSSADFLKSEADQLPKKKGDELYGVVLVGLDSGTDPHILKDENFSWPRAKRGLLEAIKRHPDALGLRAGLSSLALEAEDVDTAGGAFDDLQ